MSKDKMSQAPWILVDADRPGIDAADDSTVVLFGCDGENEGIIGRANAKAILKAVNSTYGQNIAPEAVKDMYAALHDCDDSTSLSVCFRCLSDLLPKEETSWIEWLKKQGDIIDAAIEKATIK